MFFVLFIKLKKSLLFCLFNLFSFVYYLFSILAKYGPGDQLLKWYLIPPCLTPSNIRYVLMIKWCNPGKEGAPSPRRQLHSCVILYKSWQQHPKRHQLHGHLPPITKTFQVKRTRHAGHCWRSKDELISDVLLWNPHMAKQKQDDQLEHTYSSFVWIRNVALKTCQRR